MTFQRYPSIDWESSGRLHLNFIVEARGIMYFELCGKYLPNLSFMLAWMPTYNDKLIILKCHSVVGGGRMEDLMFHHSKGHHVYYLHITWQQPLLLMQNNLRDHGKTSGLLTCVCTYCLHVQGSNAGKYLSSR
mmetsp:Transcript_8187/g.20125  ORF Transcript_8187/g.20125 Transcript_8187/m.20125 type:complete len:133 (-) Transcript_8187:60-458(-)